MAVPAHLERVKVAKRVKDAAGEEVVVAEEQYVPEPKESETDIALMAEDRARCATFAEQVRVRACIGRRGRALLCLV